MPHIPCRLQLKRLLLHFNNTAKRYQLTFCAVSSLISSIQPHYLYVSKRNDYPR